MSLPLIVLVGGGGHARVIADLIAESAEYAIAGYVCPQGEHRIPGVQRLGDDGALPELYARGIRHAVAALGDNALRKRVQEALENQGYALPALLHPAAHVSGQAKVEAGAVIMAGAVINTCAVIERGAIVNTGATVDHDCRVGAFAHIAPGCNLAGTVTIGEGAFLGVGASVIPERRIGRWSVVGAGAAVVGDVPDGSRALGVPARLGERSPA